MSEITLQAISKLLDDKLNKTLEGLATKKDIEGLATKDDLVSELKPIKAQLTSIEEKVDRLSLRTHQDDVATMKDVEKLTKRVTALEETITKLKLGYDA